MKTSIQIACACIALIGVLIGCDTQSETPPTVRPKTTATDTPGLLIVAYDSTSADTMAPPGLDSVIALEWLRHGCDSLHLALEIEQYAFGDLVTGIGPKHNGDGGYWLYKVNGEPVPEAASAHRVASADTVLFFYK